MNKKRTSIIWQLSDIDFINLIKNSKTLSEVLRYFGMENKGANYLTCKTRINELKLDTSHFLNRIQSTIFHKSITKEQFLNTLTENSTVKRCEVKKRLIKFNLLEYKCRCCGNIGEWDNKKLSLQLEHKNGISNDNRLINLEFLCPNCHSQTETYAGKNLKKYFFCIKCKNPCKGYSKVNKCMKCIAEEKRIECPISKDELIELIKYQSLSKIANKFGFCSHTIERWCERLGIEYKSISPYSKANIKPKIVETGRKFPSKYRHISYDSKRNKWIAFIKKNGKVIFYKRFEDEIEAAKAIANYYNCNELIVRKTNI